MVIPSRKRPIFIFAVPQIWNFITSPNLAYIYQIKLEFLIKTLKTQYLLIILFLKQYYKYKARHRAK